MVIIIGVLLNHLGVYAVGDNEFLKEMGQRIMVRRKALRMTQEEMAEKLGVSTQMISNLNWARKPFGPKIWQRSVYCWALVLTLF